MVGRPVFGVILLGLGVDGHKASLFPGASPLELLYRWVAAVVVVTSEEGITLAYRRLESGRFMAFLVMRNENGVIFSRPCLMTIYWQRASTRRHGDTVWQCCCHAGG